MKQVTATPSHAVQFYDSEAFLCERVATFLGEGLAGEESLVVIATSDRHQAFCRRLRDQGFDVERARSQGRFLWLEAYQMLGRFMVGVMPDWERFKIAVGDSLGHLLASPAPGGIRAYGEMVDILWKAGNPRAAIRLEEMWNEIGRAHPFRLLCAYVMGSSFHRSQVSSSVLELCGLHSAVFCPEAEAPSAGEEEEVGEQAVEALVAEIRERQRVEESLRRSLDELRQSEERERAASVRGARLQQATSRLATALTVDEVVGTLLTLSETVLGGAAGAVYLLHEESGQLRLAGSLGTPAPARRWPVLPLDAPVPMADAVKRRAPLWFESHQDLVDAYPDLARAETPRARLQACVSLPLIHAGRLVGVFGLSFEGSRRFDEADRTWLTSFAAQAALAADRAQLYQAQRATVDELTETLRVNELVEAVLAQDLRSPLGSISTAAELALLRAQRGEGQALEPALAAIVTHSRNMAHMVDQLLDLSRIRLRAGLRLERHPVDLERLLRDVVDELRGGQPGPGLNLEALGNGRGEWDGNRLFQVFSNLAGNALVHGSADRGVRLHLDGTGVEGVQVRVHNHGTISGDVVPRLFEPFVRGDGRADGSRGLGLGLYIAAEIVRAHGGQIDVESTPAAGTTFSVLLPRIAPPPRVLVSSDR